MKTLLLVVTQVLFLTAVECNPCTRVESLDITGGVLHSNGSVVHDGIEYPATAWYEDREDDQLIRFGCPCIGRICIWKCCGSQRAFFNRSCSDTNMSAINPFNPPVFKGTQLVNLTAHNHFYYMLGFPCNDKYLVDSADVNEELYVQENGTLYEISRGGSIWHQPTQYCVDMMVENHSEPRLVAGVCFPENPVTNDDSALLYTAYAVGLILSVPFLMATFLVYAVIPDLRNLHGKCLMAYCGGLIVGYLFLSYLKLHTGRIGVGVTGCLVVAFIIYYAFQTSFFWLNVMCFDIWRTFSSGYRGGSINKRRENRRFWLYAAYAWGMPVLLTACTVGMQFTDPLDFITPGFGSRKCWFENRLSELLYFYTPVFVLVVCNVVFFTVTAYRIRSIRQETAILKGAESSRSDKLKKDKQRYALYLKLFMVMGVNWSVELISFVVGGSNWYWIVVDISNIVLGLFIFLIFVWKKKVRTLVQKRFHNIFGIPPTTSDGRTTSTAPTEDTRVSGDESAMRLKDMR